MNCKPGDLAIVIRCTDPKNIGRTVRCLYQITRMETLTLPDGTVGYSDELNPWVVEVQSGPAHRQNGTCGIYGAVGDDRLLPIRPEPDPLEQKHSTPRKERA